MTLKECYEILGIAKTAKPEDVKRAYRKRAFELHPDLNPNLVDASRQFQLLNEAYVNLMRVLSAREEAAGNAKAQQRTQTRKPSPDKSTADSAGAADASSGGSRQQSEKAEKAEGENVAGASGASQSTQSTDDKKRKAADEAYARQEEVLRDILNDQFARRVFEDIYSEVSKKQERPAARVEDRTAFRQESRQEPRKVGSDAATGKAQTPPKAKKPDTEGEEKTFFADLTTGVGDAMRSWLRHQIDDELTVGLPKAKLFPGARVRLQIRQGLSKDPRVVELTLPPDFRPGKPLRLKGMGKKVGKWIGDLYLVIEAQQ